jgi:hypothetical protein
VDIVRAPLAAGPVKFVERTATSNCE